MFPAKNYTLGRGRLYFDAFVAGTTNNTGQRYFGNTTEIKLSSSSDSLDHFDSDEGVKQKDDTVLLSLTRTGSFITDNINPRNLALWFLGSESVFAGTVATALSQTITDVILDNRYQVGVSPTSPAGVRNIENVVVKVATVTKTPGTDYTLDAATGGIVPLSTGTIVAGDDLSVTYDTTAVSQNRVVTASNAAIEGSLLYIAKNPKGLNFDYYWPKVTLKPDGDFSLKGEDWQAISFTFEALKKDDNTEVLYINGRSGEGI